MQCKVETRLWALCLNLDSHSCIFAYSQTCLVPAKGKVATIKEYEDLSAVGWIGLFGCCGWNLHVARILQLLVM